MATINGDNSEAKEILVADLSIDPVTKQVDFSHSIPISLVAQESQVKESMQQLLDIILEFFTMEEQKVDSGLLSEEEMLLNDVQEDYTNTKRATRSLPPGFKRRRA